MIHFLHHEPCPDCGSRDNLGRWSDGHAWCFGCGYWEAPDENLESVKNNLLELLEMSEEVEDTLEPLPTDSSFSIPKETLTWIKGYGILDKEIRENNLMWSQANEYLIFPFLNDRSELLAWQARLFGAARRRKYLTFGEINDLIHLIGEHDGPIIVVEDVLSAIKVGRHSCAYPLLGSHLSDTGLGRLCGLTERVRFWLDYNKRLTSLKLCERSKMVGLKADVIVTEQDPKELDDAQISSILRG